MDLIDRYLVAVRRHLPPPLQKDIVDELADSLRSEAEERAQKEGRPLTDDDQAQLLKKHGHPWLMASRYLPQQQLVGPALYPYYRQALVVVVFWIVLPMALGVGALAALYAEDSTRVWGRMLGAAWNGSIYSIGIVTIVFAVLESQRVRFTALDQWDPSGLPEPSIGRAVPRSESLFGLVFGITIILWWTDLLRVPVFVLGDTEADLAAAPIWASVYLPILVSMVATVATSFVDLVRPWRSTFFSLVRIAIDAGNTVLVIVILRAGHWVDVTGTTADSARLAQLDLWVNRIVQWSLMAAFAGCVFGVLVEIRNVMKARRETVA